MCQPRFLDITRVQLSSVHARLHLHGSAVISSASVCGVDVALPSLPCGVSLALLTSSMERKGADDGFAVVLLALSVAVLYTCPGFTVYYFEEGRKHRPIIELLDGKEKPSPYLMWWPSCVSLISLILIDSNDCFLFLFLI